MRLQDKVVIVTGAASGIGEAVTKRFLDEGAKVVVDLKDETELAQRFPESAGRVLALKADVTKRGDLELIVSTTVEKFGGIDILFNNAALFDTRPILDESWDIFDRLFSVNVKGMFFLMQLVAQRMVEQGRGGKIVNMSSQARRRGEALVSHYCATKAAVIISYTQSAALGLAKHGINVNSIAPGVVDTQCVGDGRRALREVRKPPARREETAGRRVRAAHGPAERPDGLGTVPRFSSADSDYITAQTLNVDGGNWMS